MEQYEDLYIKSNPTPTRNSIMFDIQTQFAFFSVTMEKFKQWLIVTCL